MTKTMAFFAVLAVATGAAFTLHAQTPAADAPPKVPRFSVSYMDTNVSPGSNFYEYCDGQWLKDNPIPPDKSRWAAFTELAERNWYLIHQILDDAAADTHAKRHSVRREVGDFYASAMDTNLIETLGISPLTNDLARIDQVQSTIDLFALLGDFHNRGIGGIFGSGVGPDDKNSSIYAFQLSQGGLSLPDRDYYLKDSFADVRAKYRQHIQTMFMLFGELGDAAAAHADTVLRLETELARAGRSRVELRDADKNYNKFQTTDWITTNTDLPWPVYFTGLDLRTPSYVIVGQPEFFTALNHLIQTVPLADWKVYLRWHLIHSSAAYLNAAVADENFAFFGRELSGQPQQEPRWKRAAHVIDGHIGEALGQLYVEKYFPPEAKAKMRDLVNNLKDVYRGRLERVPWMSQETRAKALAKFAKFTQKIGYPDKFRDYSFVIIRPDDYLGNVRRSELFESRRDIARVGKEVDRTEWDMTPETVNAYYNPSMNEIVFPAGILQPPFFDPTMDDAVNYGAIGVVIGHEMTHGYDDQGRKYNGDGNLTDWWTDADAKAFDARAQLVVNEYNGFEIMPGLHVNGELTLGENLADLGGVNIAYEALQRVLAKDPSQRKNIDGFTPEQRFFISFAQIWRTNIRPAEARRLATVDPHSPGEFRAYGPLLNVQMFYDAFGIKEGDAMWLPPDQRAVIW